MFDDDEIFVIYVFIFVLTLSTTVSNNVQTRKNIIYFYQIVFSFQV